MWKNVYREKCCKTIPGVGTTEGTMNPTPFLKLTHLNKVQFLHGKN